MSLTLNTSVGVNSNGTTGNSLAAAAMTTTAANCIAVLVSYSFCSSADVGNYNAVTSISDTKGLNWTLRSSKQFTGTDGTTTFYLTIDTWWALQASAGANTVTANYAHTVHSSIGASFELFAVAGVQNLTNPWDSNTGLPFTNSHFGSSAAFAAGSVSTSSQPTFIFSACADTGASSFPTVGTGMTQIGSLRPGYSGVSEFVVSSSTGSQTINWSGSDKDWAVVTDALTGASAPDSATMTTALKKLTQSASGTVSDNYGTIATHLTKPSQALSGTYTPETFTGTITTRLTKLSQSLPGLEKYTGTITTTLHGISQAATQEVATGTITTSLSKVKLNAVVKEEFVGQIVTNIDMGAAFAIIAHTYEEFVGTITTNLSPMNFSQSLSGYEEMVGTITTKLGNANGHLAATVVEALEIIEGPIVMNLGKFRPLILGAKLGTAGAGPWYSWRQTAS